MKRAEKMCVGEYYHLYNRGVRHENIFFEKADYIRFIFLLLYCQLPSPLANNDYHSRLFEAHGAFYMYANREQIRSALLKRRVELVNFCLMPNHFHLTVRACEDSGVSKYMQRVLNAYTKYFNIRHKKTGHLFEGPYGAVRVKSDTQLLHLSAYIHRNPRSLPEWRNKEDRYPYSSLPDYVGKNRWGELLKHDIVLGQFSEDEPNLRIQSYKKFIETSSAKAIESKLDDEHLRAD